tara:strand:+ start:241 stop:441 length:201 start_codon:yes stop_codon:yes gene_type:complete
MLSIPINPSGYPGDDLISNDLTLRLEMDTSSDNLKAAQITKYEATVCYILAQSLVLSENGGVRVER